jgi:hypothetical protein
VHPDTHLGHMKTWALRGERRFYMPVNLLTLISALVLVSCSAALPSFLMDSRKSVLSAHW